MDYPKELMYTRSHEWVQMLDDSSARVGLTDFAQDALGDIVFVNLPEVGDTVTAEASFGDVESVKAVSEMISPVTGTVAEINDALNMEPERINKAPYETWLMVIENVTATAELLDADAYKTVCENE